MLKIQIALFILASIFFGMELAQATDRRSRLVSTTYRTIYVTDRRIKPKKFVYDMDTNQIARAPTGQRLPSQVTVKSSAEAEANLDENVALKNKNQRSIVSED
jgi:hypothetical protein